MTLSPIRFKSVEVNWFQHSRGNQPSSDMVLTLTDSDQFVPSPAKTLETVTLTVGSPISPGIRVVEGNQNSLPQDVALTSKLRAIMTKIADGQYTLDVSESTDQGTRCPIVAKHSSPRPAPPPPRPGVHSLTRLQPQALILEDLPKVIRQFRTALGM